MVILEGVINYGEFTIQISNDLVNQLVDDALLRVACASPLFLPATLPVQPVHSELEGIQSVLQESERVLERLQKQEENMLQEVTQKAKDLHDKSISFLTQSLSLAWPRDLRPYHVTRNISRTP
ncbi:hypothetical protein JHK85_012184 [Glycine max]|nr:hypothetical protein JHK85_012184 [Glycine max]